MYLNQMDFYITNNLSFGQQTERINCVQNRLHFQETYVIFIHYTTGEYGHDNAYVCEIILPVQCIYHLIGAINVISIRFKVVM